MTGIKAYSTHPATVRTRKRYARKVREAAEARTSTVKTRVCPVCGGRPGDGWNTYCGAEHMLQGAPR